MCKGQYGRFTSSPRTLKVWQRNESPENSSLPDRHISSLGAQLVTQEVSPRNLLHTTIRKQCCFMFYLMLCRVFPLPSLMLFLCTCNTLQKQPLLFFNSLCCSNKNPGKHPWPPFKSIQRCCEICLRKFHVLHLAVLLMHMLESNVDGRTWQRWGNRKVKVQQLPKKQLSQNTVSETIAFLNILRYNLSLIFTL